MANDSVTTIYDKACLPKEAQKNYILPNFSQEILFKTPHQQKVLCAKKDVSDTQNFVYTTVTENLHKTAIPTRCTRGLQ